MSWLSVTIARTRALIFRRRLEHDLNDEISFHLREQVDDNIAAGMDPRQAYYAALRDFGGIEPMKEIHRGGRAFLALEELGRDIRYALRTLRRAPGFTITAVIVLALAIGANTAMFSVLNAVLFEPLPYRDPDRLVMLWSESPSQNVREGRTSLWTVEHWRRYSQSFSEMAVLDPVSITLSTGAETHQVSGSRISPNLLPLLGVQPLHGRAFTDAEVTRRERVALISQSFWQSRFGGTLDVLNSTVTIDGVPTRIIGILPARQRAFLLGNDIFEPVSSFSDWETRRGVKGPADWFVVARLRPGVTLAQAQSEMDAVARRIDQEFPGRDRAPGVSIVPLSRQITGHTMRLALWLLAAAVLSVLLIAASNIAGLTLARSAARTREILTRAALGAGRGRIVRQLLAESLTLSLLGGLAGLIVAAGTLHLIRVFQPVDLPRLENVSLDTRVLLAALAICLFTAIFIGLAPALIAVRRNLQPSGPAGARGMTSGTAMRAIRRALVVVEVALAIVLLAAAGLLLRSLRTVEALDPGFRSDRVLMLSVASPRFPSDRQFFDFYTRLLQQVRAIPGVLSAGLVSDLFIGGSPERSITTETNAGAATERMRFRADEMSDGLLETIGATLRAGRHFSNADGPDSPRVAIVNEAMAQRLWPGLDPIGRRFKFGPPQSPAPWTSVVGVVADMRRQGLEQTPSPQMFVPITQNPSRLLNLLVRTSSPDPLVVAQSVRSAVWGVEKSASVYRISSLDARIAASLLPRRFQTSLLLAFAGIALLLAAVGVYGLIRYSIALRNHEIAIRMAVGAQAGEIFRMVLGEGLQLTLIGLAVGLVGAFWIGQAGSSLLFGVSAADPLTFISVSVLLTVVALAACYFPARRAMSIQPSVALRQD